MRWQRIKRSLRPLLQSAERFLKAPPSIFVLLSMQNASSKCFEQTVSEISTNYSLVIIRGAVRRAAAAASDLKEYRQVATARQSLREELDRLTFQREQLSLPNIPPTPSSLSNTDFLPDTADDDDEETFGWPETDTLIFPSTFNPDERKLHSLDGMADFELRLRVARAHELLDSVQMNLLHKFQAFTKKYKHELSQSFKTRLQDKMNLQQAVIRRIATEYNDNFSRLRSLGYQQDSSKTGLQPINLETDLTMKPVGEHRRKEDKAKEKGKSRKKESWIWRVGKAAVAESSPGWNDESTASAP